MKPSGSFVRHSQPHHTTWRRLRTFAPPRPVQTGPRPVPRTRPRFRATPKTSTLRPTRTPSAPHDRDLRSSRISAAAVGDPRRGVATARQIRCPIAEQAGLLTGRCGMCHAGEPENKRYGCLSKAETRGGAKRGLSAGTWHRATVTWRLAFVAVGLSYPSDELMRSQRNRRRRNPCSRVSVRSSGCWSGH